MAADTIVELAELISRRPVGPAVHDRPPRSAIDPSPAGGLLDASVSRYVKHTRREIITAFLLLSQRDNVVLKQILQDPHHPAYLPLIDDLLHDPHGGIVRLLLGFLDDPRAPSSAISVLIRRSDPKFIRNLLRKIGFAPSAAAAANLKRIDSIGWLRHRRSNRRPAQRRRTAQSGAVDHGVVNETPGRVQDDRLSGPLRQTGRPRGRGRGPGPVRRSRGQRSGPGGSGKRRSRRFRRRLCPSSANAASRCPAAGWSNSRTAPTRWSGRPRARPGEFSIERFLAAYDMLDDEVRRTTGELVRKIDPEGSATLAEELKSPSRTRRLRALGAASACGPDRSTLEPTSSNCCPTSDHVVRSRGRPGLGCLRTPTSRQAPARGFAGPEHHGARSRRA